MLFGKRGKQIKKRIVWCFFSTPRRTLTECGSGIFMLALQIMKEKGRLSEKNNKNLAAPANKKKKRKKKKLKFLEISNDLLINTSKKNINLSIWLQ